MRRIYCYMALCVLLLAACAKSGHFITRADYRKQVEQDYKHRKQWFQQRGIQVFAGVDTLPLMEKECMQFLCAYMPYSDVADYDASFFLKQVQYALMARDSFAWGRTVPEDVFRHFVLVYRVNNEDMDTARMYMFHALKDRVKHMSMHDAALEVNHWCHEHVAYRAADMRTSSPLATMRTSLGRCGEESTFAVTAFRSVGIPARQCYTPRWAHCDDNHAWVEVWVDGQWYFLGACEPDAELNMGWFAVPSTRTMMVHTKAFGRYYGSEDVVNSSDYYSELNLLSHYAPVKQLTVYVADSAGMPVADAEVQFKLYNYAEYYPLAVRHTDKNGKAVFTTGLGNILVWASHEGRYNYAKADMRACNEVRMQLSRKRGDCYVEELHIVPPLAGDAKVIPSEQQQRHNVERLAYEDSLRNAYTATFPTRHNYMRYVKPNANLTQEQLWEIVHTSEGNYEQISLFLNSHVTAEPGLYLYEYMKSYSDKDMRDISAATLEAQLTRDSGDYAMEVYIKGIMPARVSNEMVRPWREELKDEHISNYSHAIAWINEHIYVDDEANYYHCPISPCGVKKIMAADAHSRDIFFVALCRANHIPAYLDHATGQLFAYDTAWHTVTFGGEPPVLSATLTLEYYGSQPEIPLYYPHFTLQKYVNGSFVTFDFENDGRMAHFPATISVEPGYYCLSTGNRYSQGDVRSRMEFFTIGEGEHVTKRICILPLEENKKVYGHISPALQVDGNNTIASVAGEKGVVVMILGDYKEPSKHLIKEMQTHTQQWRQSGMPVYIMVAGGVNTSAWSIPMACYGEWNAYHISALETQLVKALNINFRGEYPLVAVIQPNGNICFHSEGYSVGTVDMLLKSINK